MCCLSMYRRSIYILYVYAYMYNMYVTVSDNYIHMRCQTRVYMCMNICIMNVNKSVYAYTQKYICTHTCIFAHITHTHTYIYSTNTKLGDNVLEKPLHKYVHIYTYTVMKSSWPKHNPSTYSEICRSTYIYIYIHIYTPRPVYIPIR